MDIKPIYRYVYVNKDFKVNSSGSTTIYALDNVFMKVKKQPDDFDPRLDLYLNIENNIEYNDIKGFVPYVNISNEQLDYINLWWK